MNRSKPSETGIARFMLVTIFVYGTVLDSQPGIAQVSRSGQPGKAPTAKAAEPPTIMSTEKYREKYLGETVRKSSQSGSVKLVSPYRVRFFGTEVSGETFVFVIDNSSSMLEGGRLERAHGELRRAIARMSSPQKFHVIAFDHKTLELPWGPYVTAGSENARRVGPWLSSLIQGEDTKPAGALRMAIGLKPDAVFFLTDGEFEHPTPGLVRAWNSSGIPVHVIDLNPSGDPEPLQRIANDSGGSYRKP